MEINKIILIVLLSISFTSYCQENTKTKIFLDENLETIKEADFIKKTKSFLFNHYIEERVNVSIHYLTETYKLGKLTKTELEQVQHLITVNSKRKDIKNKNIIIVFKDSLLGFNELNKSIESRKMLDHLNYFTTKEYLSLQQRHDKNQKKCIKKLKKHNTIPLYFYTKNINFSFKPKNFSPLKINSPLKHFFFFNKNYGNLILKPTGEYFYYTYFTEEFVLKFLKKENWDIYYRDYEKAIKTGIRDGFFQEMLDNRIKNSQNNFIKNDSIINESAKNKSLKLRNNVFRVRNSDETSWYRRHEPNCYTNVSY